MMVVSHWDTERSVHTIPVCVEPPYTGARIDASLRHMSNLVSAQSQEQVKQLEIRRALDAEGWLSDVTILRKQLAAVDRKLHQMRLMDRLQVSAPSEWFAGLHVECDACSLCQLLNKPDMTMKAEEEFYKLCSIHDCC